MRCESSGRSALLSAVGKPLRRVTLLTAGAGMGKTWLAAGLVRHEQRVAWVSFESTDAEGMAAWNCIVEALSPSLGAAAADVRRLLPERRMKVR